MSTAPIVPRRIPRQLRLWHLLAIPIAAAAAHYGMVLLLGQASGSYLCRECGARMHFTENSAFGLVRVGESRRIEDTTCSQLIRLLDGGPCREHRWEMIGRRRAIFVTDRYQYRCSNMHALDTAWGPASDVAWAVNWDPSLYDPLASIARTEGRDLRCFIALALDGDRLDRQHYRGPLDPGNALDRVVLLAESLRGGTTPLCPPPGSFAEILGAGLSGPEWQALVEAWRPPAQ